jgi:periplasmic protein TonB
MSKARSPRRNAFIALGALAGLILCVVLGRYVLSLIGHKAPSEKRQVAIAIKIIRPPEPPPEPPPPPPPEKTPEEIPKDQPEEKPVEQAPQSAQLGVDAEGTAGGDGFGLAANPGGRDLVGSGTGPFVFYASMVKDLVSDALSNVDRIKGRKYTVNVRVWIGADGHVEKATLAESTGSHDLDAAIEQALTHAGSVKEPPPIEMPQPITLRIVSRG